MRIEFDKKTWLDWSISGYEFPDMKEDFDEYDSNWLYLGFDIRTESRKCSLSGSFLLTWEIEEIISWLENVDRNIDEGKTELRFVESELVLRQNNSEKGLYKIEFEFYEPPDLNSNIETENILTGDLKKKDIDKIIQFLRATLDEFPVRNKD